MNYKVNGYLQNPNHAITVDVIGCGGTGSLLIARLARINFALQQMGRIGLHVTAYDNDRVELNNIGRQNFIENDLYEYKSVNVIEKCNMAFGTNWEAVNKKHTGNITANIIFICVDNAQYRKDFRDKNGKKELLKDKSIYRQGLYLFDCGNGKDFGQVVVSELYSNGLKDTVDYFPEMFSQDNEKAQRTKGCSYAEKLEEQSLFINDFIANDAADLFWKMLNQQEISAHGVVINQANSKKQPLSV